MSNVEPGCLTIIGIALVLGGAGALDCRNWFFGSASVIVGAVLLIAAWRAK